MPALMNNPLLDFRLTPPDASNFAGRVDLITTFIVLQHIPPARGMRILRRLIATLRRVRAGGIFVIDGNPAEAQDMSGYNPHKQVVEDAKGTAIEIALETLSALGHAETC